MPAKRKRLITCALPYVNNVPHLGNIVQSLSGDVFARFCRSKGYETLFICGTDEYGTATETKARELGVTPQSICDTYYEIHNTIYQWFNISFDTFGRTSAAVHTTITQDIFLQLEQNGFISEQEIEQLYSPSLKMFLPDRYIGGTCPFCGYEEARGDQCEHCGKLLDPLELINPICTIDGSTPIKQRTTHLFIELPRIKQRLERWIDESRAKERWSKNAVKITEAWVKDGLHKRAITRDLSWGIPVPHHGYENKVFYVWFDAPIGYISITASLTDDWKQWWHNSQQVALYQFVGKDNIPFHTVIFPCTLLGSKQQWSMVDTISSSEYLNYEGGQFSKSKNRGVFGTDAMDSGIVADIWRYYLCAIRPEKSDSSFSWDDFCFRINKELIGGYANLINRITSFAIKYFSGEVPCDAHCTDWFIAAAQDAQIGNIDADTVLSATMPTVAQMEDAEAYNNGLQHTVRTASVRGASGIQNDRQNRVEQREAENNLAKRSEAEQGEEGRNGETTPDITDVFDIGSDQFDIQSHFIVPCIQHFAKVEQSMEQIEIRSALRAIIVITGMANKFFQESEPWKLVHQNKDVVSTLLSCLFFVAKNLTIVIEPFVPQVAVQSRRQMSLAEDLQWSDMLVWNAFGTLAKHQVLLTPLDPKQIAALKQRFSGEHNQRMDSTAAVKHATNNSRSHGGEAQTTPKPQEDAPRNSAPNDVMHFVKEVRLIVAKIIAVDKHPNADRLFVEKVDDGSGTERQIVSGLVGYYEPEQLVGRTIVVVDNLKATKLRGVMSQGMLLAAEHDNKLEIIECDAQLGTMVGVERFSTAEQHNFSTLTIDRFIEYALELRQGVATIVDGDQYHRLVAGGEPLTAKTLTAGNIG